MLAVDQGAAVNEVALIDYGAGNLASVRKGFAAVGATLRHRRLAGRPRARLAASSFLASATSPRRRRSTTEWRRAIRRASRRRRAAARHLSRHAVALRGQRRRRRTFPASGCFTGRCTRLEAERPLKVPHVGLEHAAAPVRRVATARAICRPARPCISRTPSRRRVTAESPPRPTHGGRSPPPSNAIASGASSFIRRNRRDAGLRMLRQLRPRMANALNAAHAASSPASTCATAAS